MLIYPTQQHIRVPVLFTVDFPLNSPWNRKPAYIRRPYFYMSLKDLSFRRSSYTSWESINKLDAWKKIILRSLYKYAVESHRINFPEQVKSLRFGYCMRRVSLLRKSYERERFVETCERGLARQVYHANHLKEINWIILYHPHLIASLMIEKKRLSKELIEFSIGFTQ